MAQLGSTVVAGSLTVTDDVNLVKPLSIANGGTGATDAATARTNLGVASADVFTAPTSTSQAGTKGLVPAPTAAMYNPRALAYITANGTWRTPADIAVCETAASTVAKVATMTSYRLVSGAHFKLYLYIANTAANPTLNINSTGAKIINVNGVKIETDNAASLAIGWYDVVYNGTDYELWTSGNVFVPQARHARVFAPSAYTCNTAGDDAAKVLTIKGAYSLAKGTTFLMALSNANTVANATLNVNGTGAKAINVNGAAVTAKTDTANSNLAAGTYLVEYNGSAYRFTTGTYTTDYARVAATATDCSYPESKFDAYCDTAAGTAAKVGRCRGFSIYSGAIISLRVTVANTAASPTLNVQSSGAKTIHINGAAVSSSNQLSAGLYIGYYDGTYWQLIRTSAPTLTVDSFFSPDVAFSYTAAATVAKTAVMPSYKLITGARFRLYVVNTNTVENPTLSVNGTTAKSIAVNGTKITTASTNLAAGWYEVIYDGTNYNLYSSTNVVTPVTAGGTGATSAADARTNLGAQATITGAATSITSSNLTASRALVSNSSGKVAISDVTSTELGYLDGATSNIQEQINTKAGTAVATTSSNGLMSSSDKTKLDNLSLWEIV